MSKPRFNLVSLSGGKDSTAMLLSMIERNMPIDMILFCDTGLEFPAMYRHIEKLNRYVHDTLQMEITIVQPEYPFEYYFKDIPINRKENSSVIQKFGDNPNGYGWAGPKMRWCTSRLKDMPRMRLLQPYREQYDIYEYVGIAADEQYRLERKRNQSERHIHPLVEWNMTEADCLQYCYDCGYDREGLYEKIKRVSCWCCPLQVLDELRVLYREFPDLWKQLEIWDEMTWRKFRADYSVKELQIRFDMEAEWLKNGKSIHSREFYRALRERLGKEEHIDGQEHC